jgi:hypothetical protein
LRRGAFAHDDADLGRAFARRHPVELADGQEQQVGRHLRRRCEPDAPQVAA